MSTETQQSCAEALAALKAARPLVHNITNYVAMDISANALLAIGASPAMVHAAEEVEAFTAISSALVLNIGTLSPAWVVAMKKAQRTAQARAIPVVLDPVGVGATPYRTQVATELLEAGVTVVRGNASEVMALAGSALGPTRGVDSSHGAEEAEAAGLSIAARYRCVVAITGEVDLVCAAGAVTRVAGGHPLMPAITAMGCSLSGLVGAFCGATQDPAQATTAALACYAVAGKRASEGAAGPGSFRVRFLDELYALTPERLAAEVELS